MSFATKCVCDGCGKIKGDANKWLLACKQQLRIRDGCASTFLGARAWDDDAAHVGGVLHLCGESCLLKLLSAHLAARTVVAEAPEAAELAAEERSYVPIECEFCGPHCDGGAEHHARVEAGARYSDGGER